MWLPSLGSSTEIVDLSRDTPWPPRAAPSRHLLPVVSPNPLMISFGKWVTNGEWRKRKERGGCLLDGVANHPGFEVCPF
ncbi:hypothetical protein GW17_00061887 [Ensete ventricosum]|nr:hypothetical protein GW17_00061887 [Ensete ventricosum]